MIVDIKVQAISKSIISTAALIPITFGASVAAETIGFDSHSELVNCHDVKIEAVATEPSLRAEALSIFKVRIADFIEIDKDTLWVTPEVWEQIQIMSNVEWTIV